MKAEERFPLTEKLIKSDLAVLSWETSATIKELQDLFEFWDAHQESVITENRCKKCEDIMPPDREWKICINCAQEMGNV